jgi:hypothetical protein
MPPYYVITLTITQHGCAIQMFTKFGFLHCNVVVVPMFFLLKFKVDIATPPIDAQL